MSVNMTSMGYGDCVESVDIELRASSLLSDDAVWIRESLGDAIAALRGARRQMSCAYDGSAYVLLIEQLERVVIELREVDKK